MSHQSPNNQIREARHKVVPQFYTDIRQQSLEQQEGVLCHRSRGFHEFIRLFLPQPGPPKTFQRSTPNGRLYVPRDGPKDAPVHPSRF